MNLSGLKTSSRRYRRPIFFFGLRWIENEKGHLTSLSYDRLQEMDRSLWASQNALDEGSISTPPTLESMVIRNHSRGLSS